MNILMMFWRFLEPLTYGDYPKSMRDLVGKRLPKFTLEEAMMLKGSFDFLGLNYYTANFAADLRSSNTVNKSFSTDSQTNLTSKLTDYQKMKMLITIIKFIFSRYSL